MTYELAKELKDAGFPQTSGVGKRFYQEFGHPRLGIPHQYAVNTQVSEFPDGEYGTGMTKIPTLEELIAACGERFDYLERGINGGWFAYHEVFGKDGDDVGRGETPTEAVATLWLALQKV